MALSMSDFNISVEQSEIHFGFGATDDVPAHSSGDPQGFIMGHNNSQRSYQISRANNATRRGYYRGGVRVGFRQMDVSKLRANSDSLLLVTLFCFVQECNDTFGDWSNVPDPPSGGSGMVYNPGRDNIRGYFSWNLKFAQTAVDPDVHMQMVGTGRVSSLGGRALGPEETYTHGLGDGDFFGFELQWWASDDPSINPRPIIYLRGYSYTQPDFSDPKLRQIVGFDYRVRTAEERTPAFEAHAARWNIAGVFAVDNPDIKPPLLEGVIVGASGTGASSRDQSWPLVHYEVMTGQ